MANISLVISQCEYKNRDNANLNHHVKVEHGDIVYHCDQCDYEAKTRRLVGRHNKAKQDVVFPSLTFLCVNSSQLNCRACSLQVLGGIGLTLTLTIKKCAFADVPVQSKVFHLFSQVIPQRGLSRMENGRKRIAIVPDFKFPGW